MTGMFSKSSLSGDIYSLPWVCKKSIYFLRVTSVEARFSLHFLVPNSMPEVTRIRAIISRVRNEVARSFVGIGFFYF